MRPSEAFVQSLLTQLPISATHVAIADSAGRLVALQLADVRPDRRGSMQADAFVRGYVEGVADRLAEAAGIDDLSRRRVLRQAVEAQAFSDGDRVAPTVVPPLPVSADQEGRRLEGEAAGRADAGEWLSSRQDVRSLKARLESEGLTWAPAEALASLAIDQLATLGAAVTGRLEVLRMELMALQGRREAPDA